MTSVTPNCAPSLNESDSAVWQNLSPAEQTLLEQLVVNKSLWSPQPGPQTQAYYSLADELFFGGAAGGGKTDLALGLALTAHQKSLFLRREAVQLKAAIQRLKVIATSAGWASSGHGGTMTLPGRTIELAGCEHEDDREKYQGRDHDLKVFDELPHFSRSQYRFIIGWNRSANPEQRCRVVCSGNPPTKPEDRWVVDEWAPWLDPQFPEPAEPGELRWYAVVPGEKGQEGRLEWRRSGEPFANQKGEIITPRSRTFIPALLQDNPILYATGYLSVLQSMPEPLRSQMLYGDFSAGVMDDSWQVIPTAWVYAAQKRWQATPPGPLDCLGVDVAYGGADSTVIVPRHGSWFARPRKTQGEATDSGPKAAALVMRDHQGRATVNVDGIGYGASCCDSLKEYPGMRDLVHALNVAKSCERTDKTGKFRLTNLRTALYWTMREALDPETGDNLALPPGPEVVADLCSARYQLRASGIAVESKDDIKKRIGRSPDVGDGIVLARWETSSSSGWKSPLQVAAQLRERNLPKHDAKAAGLAAGRRFGLIPAVKEMSL